uniref:PWWP domain-containing protein n=1 Tax=Rhodnius prolixus TaxID=13249 RepID=T1HN25_RHOPR
MNSVSFLKNKYEEGDKVFAKVKGYRYWPAKITSVFTSRSNFVKYNVLFYGSNQTGVVKEDQICNYIENKKEHGKLKKKNRSFEKAILEIDADIEDFTTIRANISQIASVNNNLETEFSLVEGEFILATKQSGEIVKIPLNLNRPHFTDDNRKAKWDEIVLHQAKLLKARIEIGETVLAQQEMDNWTKSKAFEIQRRHHLEQKNKMYRSAFGRNKYEVGETVFAKIPGFPYWPAKIWSVIKGSPDKVRYEVYIYGFKQIRVLKEHRLCKSMEIMKLDRLKMTNKWFRKAVEDFERDVNIMTTILNEMAQLRLSDEPLKRDCKAIKGKPDGDVISATDPLGLQIDIPLNLNRPNFADDKRATEWNVIVLQQAYLLKARIERGETVSAHQEMDDWTKSKAFEVRRGLLLERKRQRRVKVIEEINRRSNNKTNGTNDGL